MSGSRGFREEEESRSSERLGVQYDFRGFGLGCWMLTLVGGGQQGPGGLSSQTQVSALHFTSGKSCWSFPMLVNSPLLLYFKTNIDIPSCGVYLLDGGTSEAHSHP